ncbi:MAG: hypothetical protein WC414_04285 [Patescibacteria group bacterium]
MSDIKFTQKELELLLAITSVAMSDEGVAEAYEITLEDRVQLLNKLSRLEFELKKEEKVAEIINKIKLRDLKKV